MENQTKMKPLIGADNNALIAVLSINMVVYAIIGFLKVVYYLNGTPLELFYTQIMSPSILHPSIRVFTHQPWTLFTYSWVHDGFWVLFTNMMWLTAFGFLLQEQEANKHIFPIYFYAGIVAAIFYVCIGAPLPIMGAQVGVIAIAIASVSWNPHFRILKNVGGGIPTWILTLLYVIGQSLSIQKPSFALIISYLMAAGTGFLYVQLLNRGIDIGKWMHRFLYFLNNSLAPKK